MFSTDRPFNAADPTTFPASFIGNAGDPNFRMVSTGVAAFAQDAWHLPRHVTVNAGFRFGVGEMWNLNEAMLDDMMRIMLRFFSV